MIINVLACFGILFLLLIICGAFIWWASGNFDNEC